MLSTLEMYISTGQAQTAMSWSTKQTCEQSAKSHGFTSSVVISAVVISGVVISSVVSFSVVATAVVVSSSPDSSLESSSPDSSSPDSSPDSQCWCVLEFEGNFIVAAIFQIAIYVAKY